MGSSWLCAARPFLLPLALPRVAGSACAWCAGAGATWRSALSCYKRLTCMSGPVAASRCPSFARCCAGCCSTPPMHARSIGAGCCVGFHTGSPATVGNSGAARRKRLAASASRRTGSSPRPLMQVIFSQQPADPDNPFSDEDGTEFSVLLDGCLAACAGRLVYPRGCVRNRRHASRT